MLYTQTNIPNVSLTGEQSVGKSFALNHLVDTSFAGSAMRTTGESVDDISCYREGTRYLNTFAEGIWMSVTPTEDSLIVALDFEGL